VFPSELIDPRNASDEIAALATATAWQYTSSMTKLGAKNAFYALFYTKNDHCSKTGSGQT
jgi:hypothetical protein